MSMIRNVHTIDNDLLLITVLTFLKYLFNNKPQNAFHNYDLNVKDLCRHYGGSERCLFFF